jgi:hypothetical protein
LEDFDPLEVALLSLFSFSFIFSASSFFNKESSSVTIISSEAISPN